MSSSLQLTQNEFNSNGKRPAPSASRLEKLKQLKEKNGAKKSINLSNVTPSKPSVELSCNIPQKLTAIETDVSMIKRRNGEQIPKVHRKGDPRKRNLLFGIPKFMVKWQQLGKDGNLGQFSNDPNKARFTVGLDMGCPEELKEIFPNMEEEQKQFFQKLQTICKEHMEMAFVQVEDPSWDICKGDKEMEEFVKAANYSCIKEVKDENNDTFNVIQTQRRLTDFQGNPNPPVFWKSNTNGEYEVIEPRYIPKGAVIQCTGTLRAYKVNADMYGVSMDLGRDIIVVWMPPKDKPQEKKKLPVVPFINFEY